MSPTPRTAGGPPPGSSLACPRCAACRIHLGAVVQEAVIAAGYEEPTDAVVAAQEWLRADAEDVRAERREARGR